jgi:general secretion pathway protein G
MVTMVIIALMIGVVVVNVRPATGKGLVVRTQSDISRFEQALELYRLDVFDYPNQNIGLEALVTRPSNVDEARYSQNGYISKLQDDPWGRPYIYRYPGENGVYDILSYGADGEPGGEGINADIVSWE